MMYKIIETKTPEEIIWPLEGMLALLRRPWWTRMWIIQEIAAAQKVKFFCGEDELDELGVFLALRLFDGTVDRIRNSALITPYQEHFMNTIGRWGTRGLYMPGLTSHLPCHRLALPEPERRLTLQSWLLNCHASSPDQDSPMKASDARDLVLSLLGIANDVGALEIVPDYVKSVAEIYRDTMKAFIRDGDLKMLSYAQGSSQFPGLPSWVPDVSNLYPLLHHNIVLDRFSVSDISSQKANTSTPVVFPYQVCNGIWILCIWTQR